MIKNSTVFVLGAGASMPYGFPSGKRLVDEIVLRLSHKNRRPTSFGSTREQVEEQNKKIWFDEKLFGLLTELEHSSGDIFDFVRDLRDSRAESIDAFLEQREVYMELGKAAIAYVLSIYENEESLYQENIDGEPDDWYRHVWNIMTKNVEFFEELKNNQVRFVTFNYDRSLEHYLMRGMKAWFGRTEDDCKNVLNQIPIIHLHGSLGPLPWQTMYVENVMYGKIPDDAETLRRMTDSIKIISESMPKNQFDETLQFFQTANQVFFLGFGYHDTNMRRLKVREVTRRKMRGTCFGLTPREINLLNVKYNDKLYLSAKHNGLRSLMFLREEVGLEEPSS